MTGEELNKKYHELCGWTLQRVKRCDPYPKSGWIYAWTPPGVERPEFGHEDKKLRDAELPALHLDANLAIAEADRVFVEWLYRSCPFKSRHRINAYWERNPETGFYRSLEVTGATLCEAILKALIAAKEAKPTTT